MIKRTRILKKAVLGCFKMYRYLPGESEENHVGHSSR
jgi:hypothetical protein